MSFLDSLITNKKALIALSCGVAVLALSLLIACCIVLRRCQVRKKAKQQRLKRSNTQRVTNYGNIDIIYNKEIEYQQPPLIYPAKSCPSTPNAQRKPSRRSAERRSAEDLLHPTDLDLDIYANEQDETEKYPQNELGRLCYSLKYSAQRKTLIVTIKKVENLKTSVASPCPYVKLGFVAEHKAKDKDKRKRSHTKTRKGNSPVFDEVFEIEISPDKWKLKTLRFTVCDFDRFSRQNIIGYVMVPLVNLADKIEGEDGSGDIWSELVATVGGGKGELLVSLSHLPTACRINVAVLKGKNMFLQEKFDYGVNVKIHLLLDNKVVKVRKTSIRKTDIINPVFNESFVFDISNEVLDRISFEFVVQGYPHGTHSNKRIIGKTTAGPNGNASENGIMHWNDMLAAPRSAAAFWHELSCCVLQS